MTAHPPPSCAQATSGDAKPSKDSSRNPAGQVVLARPGEGTEIAAREGLLLYGNVVWARGNRTSTVISVDLDFARLLCFGHYQ